MIDREGYGAGFFFKKKPAEPAIEDDYPEQSGLSKKAIVYLVIIGLIIVLCIVYVFQLRIYPKLRRHRRKRPRRELSRSPLREKRRKPLRSRKSNGPAGRLHFRPSNKRTIVRRVSF